MKLSIDYLKKLIMNEVKEAKRMPKPIPPDIAAAQKAAEKSGIPTEFGQKLDASEHFLDMQTEAWNNHFGRLSNVDPAKIEEMVVDLYGRIEEMYGLNKHGSK